VSHKPIHKRHIRAAHIVQRPKPHRGAERLPDSAITQIGAGDDLADDVTVVLRGGVLDADLLRQDALRNHAICATYGILVFAARDLTVDELAQQAPLIRFEQPTLLTVGALRSAGQRPEATGRNRRRFDISFDDLDDGVTRLASCEHRIIIPYHETRPSTSTTPSTRCACGSSSRTTSPARRSRAG
jgi:hypothetical protein